MPGLHLVEVYLPKTPGETSAPSGTRTRVRWVRVVLRASFKCSVKCEVRHTGACWRKESAGNIPQASSWNLVFGAPQVHSGPATLKMGYQCQSAQNFCPPPVLCHY